VPQISATEPRKQIHRLIFLLIFVPSHRLSCSLSNAFPWVTEAALGVRLGEMSLVKPSLPSRLLGEMLSEPLVFGEVVQKGNWATSVGTKEVLMGPSSPPHRPAQLDGPTRSSQANGHASSSTSHLVTPPKTSQQTSLSTVPTTPPSDRKGKSPDTSLYPADIDLTWPSSVASLRTPAAGLYNPSMACYANATLQVILHTPPVLRIAQGHDPPTCECACVGFWRC